VCVEHIIYLNQFARKAFDLCYFIFTVLDTACQKWFFRLYIFFCWNV